jgi:hypothetical protein
MLYAVIRSQRTRKECGISLSLIGAPLCWSKILLFTEGEIRFNNKMIMLVASLIGKM